MHIPTRLIVVTDPEHRKLTSLPFYRLPLTRQQYNSNVRKLSIIDYLNLNRSVEPATYHPPIFTLTPNFQEAYLQSKLCNALFAYEFDRKFNRSGIHAIAVSPGSFIRGTVGCLLSHYFALTRTQSPVQKIGRGSLFRRIKAYFSDKNGKSAAEGAVSV